MKYIVITSKHHDGFCLFDSKQTDFDVMSTPFKRDILKELADACRDGRDQDLLVPFDHGLAPSRLPARAASGRQADRPTGADFDRYVALHEEPAQGARHQLRPDRRPLVRRRVGEAPGPTSAARDLYDYVRGLQPDIIINNRVGEGRAGMAGLRQGRGSRRRLRHARAGDPGHRACPAWTGKPA